MASKYSLLKNEKELNPKQKDKLIEVRNASPTLKIMHQLKEKFRKIFEKVERWADGLIELGGCLSTAHKYFVNSHSTIVRWLNEILAYFDNRTISGVVEGINNKLKLIKRSAYGFTNFDDVPRKVKNSSLIISPFDDWTITNSGGSKRASPKCLGRFSLLQKQLRKLHR